MSQEAKPESGAATNASAIAETALEAAQDRQKIIEDKRHRARVRWHHAHRELLARQETERLEKAVELMHRMRGRPESIPDATIEAVLELHADGEPLKTACEAFGISRLAIVGRALKDSDLAARLSRAREENAHAKMDGSWAIARTEPDVERAKLLVDLCRWEVSKVLPHIYGDRVKLDAPDGVVFSLNIGQLVDRKEEKLVESIG